MTKSEFSWTCCFGSLKSLRKNKIDEILNSHNSKEDGVVINQIRIDNKKQQKTDLTMEKISNFLEYEEDSGHFKNDSYSVNSCITVSHVDNQGKKLILDSKQMEMFDTNKDMHVMLQSTPNTNKLGRAISQPFDSAEFRSEGFRIGEFDEDESMLSSCSSFKRRMQSRRRPNRSLYGVSPDCKFGPKGYLAQGSCANLTIPDPSNQKLNWTKEPLYVLIVRKHLDESVMIPFRDLLIWLVEAKGMVVLVEQAVMDDRILRDDKDFQRLHDKLKTFKEDDDLTDKVDFIICLGGDGTLLYVSSLFQSNVPPVMAFNMGSLGFLTPFRFDEYFKTEVSKVMQGSASLLLRYRLKCVVVRHDTEPKQDIPHVKNIQKGDVWTKTHKLVLNEVVVDRGPISYLCNLELYIEGRRVTTVQGDGLIISTPTGSTAYAVAAGASMIHPSVPCILLTPICPHSLSFRPIVVPAGVEIKVMLSPDARGTAMVSFDGRDRMEIHQGDSLRITTSNYPVPSICATDQIEDWFDGLANCLNWNIRHQQRPLQAASSVTSFESLEVESTKSSQSSLLNGNS